VNAIHCAVNEYSLGEIDVPVLMLGNDGTNIDGRLVVVFNVQASMLHFFDQLHEHAVIGCP